MFVLKYSMNEYEFEYRIELGLWGNTENGLFFKKLPEIPENWQ